MQGMLHGECSKCSKQLSVALHGGNRLLTGFLNSNIWKLRFKAVSF